MKRAKFEVTWNENFRQKWIDTSNKYRNDLR